MITDQRGCTGTTTASGTATCTIDSVDQPQGPSNAVPVAVTFGDDNYNPSGTSAELGLTSPTELDCTGVTHGGRGVVLASVDSAMHNCGD
ncbi:hypothetical protein ABZ446_22850 [Streptomyces sp. NPDC005813]|uniref:hypothetical protein n=1 Tax=Streptomyces sp. NPDC005813 TaxID=3155592 RepID=UPI003403AF0F